MKFRVIQQWFNVREMGRSYFFRYAVAGRDVPTPVSKVRAQAGEGQEAGLLHAPEEPAGGAPALAR